MTELARRLEAGSASRPRGRHRAPDVHTIPLGGDGTPTRFAHQPEYGFCVICGSVWPCARSRRGDGPAHVRRPDGAGPEPLPGPR